MAEAGVAAGPLEPTRAGERITTLDAVRGVAVLGILTMNAVSYGLDPAAYLNVSAGGIATWLDWTIGGAGEILFDQKFMGLFSMLFGAGIVLFHERAADKGRRANWLSLWRNTLLLGIGILHAMLWDGDILILYAICAPFLIALRPRRPRTLLALGGGLLLCAAALALAVQLAVDGDGVRLGNLWTPGDGPAAGLQAWFVGDAFLRGLGMMLIGVALYRTGVVTGERSPAFYRRAALWGLAVGLPLSAGGFALVAASDFSPTVALAGAVPNTLATFPLAFAYLSLIALWNGRAATWLHHRIRAAGRMALTNYLTQTILGVIVLRTLFDAEDLTRSWIAVFIVAVWALQLAWSGPWLARFRYGPFEWVWRCATYRRRQALRVQAPISREGTAG